MHPSAVRPEWTDVCAEIEAGLKRRFAPLPSAVPSVVRRMSRVRNAVGTGSRPVHRWQASGGSSEDGARICRKKKLMGDALRECANVPKSYQTSGTTAMSASREQP